MSKIEFNGSEYEIEPCQCGNVHLRHDAGMMGCVIWCAMCRAQVVHNGFQDCLEAWNERMKKGDEMPSYDDGPQCDPLQQARERVRGDGPRPQPGYGMAQGLRAGLGNQRGPGGVEAQCDSLYNAADALETALAQIEVRIEPYLGPELPEVAGMEKAAEMPNSKIGHRLAEIDGRIRRVTRSLRSITCRID